MTVPSIRPPYPVVIFVHDSGNLDRHGSVGAARPYEDIAIELAKLGIASIRFDKRTHVYGSRIDRKALTYETEIVEDVVAAINQARRLLLSPPLPGGTHSRVPSARAPGPSRSDRIPS